MALFLALLLFNAGVAKAEETEFLAAFPKEWVGTYGEEVGKCNSQHLGDDFMIISNRAAEWSEMRCNLKQAQRQKDTPDTLELGFVCSGEGEESVELWLWHRLVVDSIVLLISVDPRRNYVHVYRRCDQ